jgi:uracil-DNA glycosylase
MKANIGDWKEHLEGNSKMEYFQSLLSFLNDRRKLNVIYPPKGTWFRAFELSSFAKTKVVILGQDPYHGEGQAEGLSFSVPKNISIPPSLRNIYKELETNDVGFVNPGHGHLSSWSKQGVLLLNSVLTVEKNTPAAHANQGWEIFTDNVIKLLDEKKDHLVFLLWGAYAGRKSSLIDSERHLVLKSPHPSPFSASNGFFGSRHFVKTNEYLQSSNQSPIKWQIPS